MKFIKLSSGYVVNVAQILYIYDPTVGTPYVQVGRDDINLSPEDLKTL